MQVILFRGKAGVGKTTIATALAAKLGHVLVSRDTIFDPMRETGVPAGLADQATWAIIRNIIRQNAMQDTTLILDLSLNDLAYFEQFRSYLDAFNPPITLCSFHLYCSDKQSWRNRIEARAAAPKPNQTITDFDQLLAHYAGIKDVPASGETMIDTAAPLENCVDKIMERLRRISTKS